MDKGCSILTTTPNAITTTVHDRMPVIPRRDCYDLWLDPGMQKVAPISELLKPYDADSMRSYPVSSRINHVATDDEDCSMPLPRVRDQNSLFSLGTLESPEKNFVAAQAIEHNIVIAVTEEVEYGQSSDFAVLERMHSGSGDCQNSLW